jgi:DNA-binding transcriptional LysR family regulator
MTKPISAIAPGAGITKAAWLTVLAIAEGGNFDQAAKRLYIGQPLVTVRLRELETALGKPLFFRDKTPRATPTDAGWLVFEKCKALSERVALYQVAWKLLDRNIALERLIKLEQCDRVFELAKACHISQAGASVFVAEYQRLGLLTKAIDHRISLTPLGETGVRESRELFAALEAIAQDVKSLDDASTDTGSLVVSLDSNVLDRLKQRAIEMDVNPGPLGVQLLAEALIRDGLRDVQRCTVTNSFD